MQKSGNHKESIYSQPITGSYLLKLAGDWSHMAKNADVIHRISRIFIICMDNEPRYKTVQRDSTAKLRSKKILFTQRKYC